MAWLELMIAVLQRASAGRVTVKDRVIGEIGTGSVSYTHLTLPTIYSV